MKVIELIAKLQECDPDATVEVWDPYNDMPSTAVEIEQYENDKAVLITNRPV